MNGLQLSARIGGQRTLRTGRSGGRSHYLVTWGNGPRKVGFGLVLVLVEPSEFKVGGGKFFSDDFVDEVLARLRLVLRVPLLRL